MAGAAGAAGVLEAGAPAADTVVAGTDFEALAGADELAAAGADVDVAGGADVAAAAGADVAADVDATAAADVTVDTDVDDDATWVLELPCDPAASMMPPMTARPTRTRQPVPLALLFMCRTSIIQ
jgi:hypothetical protein